MPNNLEPTPRKRPRLDTVVSLRVPSDVADSWRAAAGGAGVSFSDWVRGQVSAGDGVTVQSGKPTPARGAGGRRNAAGGDPELVLAVNRVGVSVIRIARQIDRSPVDNVLAQQILAQGLDVMNCLRAIYRTQVPRRTERPEDRGGRPETDGGGAH